MVPISPCLIWNDEIIATQNVSFAIQTSILGTLRLEMLTGKNARAQSDIGSRTRPALANIRSPRKALDIRWTYTVILVLMRLDRGMSIGKIAGMNETPPGKYHANAGHTRG